MGIFSKLFGGEKEDMRVRKRENQPDVMNVSSEDNSMNWAMQKARLTLHYFEACLQNVKPEQDHFSIKVKIEDQSKSEHLWLVNPSFDEEGNLFGVVGNAPIDVQNVNLNQNIGIDRKKVSDWMIIENGRLIGGYTIRVLRDGLSGDALQQFDRSLGGMIVDEGEDYFKEGFDTPESAITTLENAYDENNIEKALACKDFKEEAQEMLQQYAGMAQNEDLLNSTAEALRLSYLKSLQDNGMPSFQGVKRAFTKRELVSIKHMVIDEVCVFPNGQKTKQRLKTVKTDAGWRVMSPLS